LTKLLLVPLSHLLPKPEVADAIRAPAGLWAKDAIWTKLGGALGRKSGGLAANRGLVMNIVAAWSSDLLGCSQHQLLLKTPCP